MWPGKIAQTHTLQRTLSTGRGGEKSGLVFWVIFALMACAGREWLEERSWEGKMPGWPGTGDGARIPKEAGKGRNGKRIPRGCGGGSDSFCHKAPPLRSAQISSLAHSSFLVSIPVTDGIEFDSAVIVLVCWCSYCITSSIPSPGRFQSRSCSSLSQTIP